MFEIALFALIGAMINAWPAYWIVFGIYCFVWLLVKVFGNK